MVLVAIIIIIIKCFKSKKKILQGCLSELGVRGITWFLGVVLAKISSWDARTTGKVKKSFSCRKDTIKDRVNHIYTIQNM